LDRPLSLENLEASENLTADMEMLGNLLDVWELSGKNSLTQKTLKVSYWRYYSQAAKDESL